MDIKLTAAGDLDLSSGDLVILEGINATSQRLERKLRMFQGEWFLDERLGVPYFQDILVKNPKTNVIMSIYREAISEDEAVTALNNLELNFDSVARKLFVTFEAETVDGPLSFDTEFIIG